MEDIFIAAQRWLERLPGDLAVATLFASAWMSAMCGASMASAALSSIAVPPMFKHGPFPRVPPGIVTVPPTLAIMIPPNIEFVIWAMIVETSIGKTSRRKIWKVE